MQHLEPQRLDQETMNGIGMLLQGFAATVQKNPGQMLVEPIHMSERKPKLQLVRQQVQIEIGKKPTQRNSFVTRHENPIDGPVHSLAGELLMPPKEGVSTVPIASERTRELDLVAVRSQMLMLGAVRD